MIPHRMLSREIFANDLKDRVTACRKRLRLNRIHRIHFDNQVGQVFCETAIEASDFCDHSEDESGLCEHNEHNGQEVGIT